jgi:gas vesicle protein
MKKANVVLVAMGGIVTGLIFGILFAPNKGSKTRRKISRKGEEITEEIKNKIHQFGEFINEKLDGTFGNRNLIRTGRTKI